MKFERTGRGVVRLALSLFLAPKTSPATWENLCSAKDCSGLSEEILNILNSPKKGADSDLCARSARTREEETGLTCGGSFVAMACARGIPEFLDLSARTRERKTGPTKARVTGGALARGYSGKLMFGASSVHAYKSAWEG